MAIGTARQTQPNIHFRRKVLRQGSAFAAILIVAQQPCMGTEIYRWIDPAGKVHFSDTPPSRGASAPLRAPASAPAVTNSSNIPENHYSVINQAKRFESNRLKRKGTRAASAKEHTRANRGRGIRADRPHYYEDDRGYAGFGCCSNLGPRTDLIKFPPPGHPVYSPTLGFPRNKHHRKGHHKGGRLSMPFLETPYARPSRGGSLNFRR